MKRLFITFTTLIVVIALHAKDIVINLPDGWIITWVEKTGVINIEKQNQGVINPVVMNAKPEASYVDAKGVSHTVNSIVLPKVLYTHEDIGDNNLGGGIKHVFTYTSDDSPAILTQTFYVYDTIDGIIVDLKVSDSQGDVKSNYLAPLYSTSTYNIFGTSSSHNRMLKVPYDNDGFVRYQRYKLSTQMTSYEVTSIYEGDSHHGVVIGSIDHDHWKSAITVKATRNNQIQQLKVFSGVSDKETHDVLPHGYLHGKEVSSARFYIGYSDDWRYGMEAFAETCLMVAPQYDTWTGGTPMGWQSWGVLADHCNNEDVTAIADYYAQVLQPAGFHNSLGKTVMSIDSWSNMSDYQLKTFAQHAAKQDQVTGFYMCPFSLWWGADDKDKYVGTVNGIDYKVRDVCVRVNGEPYIYDGCFCRDPTHPLTRQEIVNFVNACSAKGIKYIKCDFLSCGMIQSDSYYDKTVTTAVEAYNAGMKLLASRCKAKGIYIAESISPIFPYQYANSRRISCDTWGKIDQTEYSMNAISGGWWTDVLYQYNDPDHVVLVGHGDQSNTTLGENRARYTNAAITGMMLVADNFSDANNAQRGNPSLSKERAQTIMLNKDVNEIVDMGVSFRPLYGYNEYLGNADRAEHFHIYRTEDYLYLAGINYSSLTSLKGSIGLAELGLLRSDFTEVKELWTGANVSVDTTLSYNIPQKDARIYRFTLRDATKLTEARMQNNPEDVRYSLSGIKLESTRKNTLYLTKHGKFLRR